jgi:hypothetical protein
MGRVSAFLACILAFAASACSSLEGRYFREGIGNDVYWSGLPEATRLQELYLGFICQQAGLPTVADGDVILCAYAGMTPPEWALFVQAGMNDIDRRCDAYLGWLDDKRRSREPILKQLADMGAATAGILRATNVGATPIAVVGIAFGLAADTFTNISSRLLLEVNHSTVQSVVLGYQADFRKNNVKVLIDNRPAAIYLLRSYLRLCMPYSIEMSINNTVTIYHRDPAALNTEPLLLRTPVASRLQAAGAILHSVPPGGARSPLPGVAGTPGWSPKPEVITGAQNDVERQIREDTLEGIQTNLCVQPTTRFDPQTREAIRQAKIAAGQRQLFNNRENEIKTRREVQILLGAQNCSKDASGKERGYLTAFEKFRFPGRNALGDLRHQLNACGYSLTNSESFDESTRTAIAAVKARASVSEKATFGDPNSNTLNEKSYDYIKRTCIP